MCMCVCVCVCVCRGSGGGEMREVGMGWVGGGRVTLPLTKCPFCNLNSAADLILMHNNI